MSELGDRIRSTFEEIAPPIDVERIAEHRRPQPVGSRRRPGWLIAASTAVVVLVAGVGSVLLFGGGNDGESANTTVGTTTTVTSSPDTTTTPSIANQEALNAAIATWVNQTGIPQMDRDLWATRLDRACAEGVWDDEVAYRLAAEFVAADVGDGTAPAAGEAPQALWLMAVNYCRDSFPAGEIEDGPPNPTPPQSVNEFANILVTARPEAEWSGYGTCLDLEHWADEAWVRIGSASATDAARGAWGPPADNPYCNASAVIEGTIRLPMGSVSGTYRITDGTDSALEISYSPPTCLTIEHWFSPCHEVTFDPTAAAEGTVTMTGTGFVDLIGTTQQVLLVQPPRAVPIGEVSIDGDGGFSLAFTLDDGLRLQLAEHCPSSDAIREGCSFGPYQAAVGSARAVTAGAPFTYTCCATAGIETDDLVRIDDGPLSSALLDDLGGFIADGATVTDAYDMADPQVPAYGSANVWLRLPDGTRLGVINQQVAPHTAEDLRRQMFADGDNQPGWPSGVRVVRAFAPDWGQVSALWNERLLHVRWELGPVSTDRGEGLSETATDAFARVIATTLIRSDVEVASGWELVPGDVVVADATGVRQVRDGEVIATLYTGPASAAIPDSSGSVIVAAADRAMLGPWGGGADRLLRIRPDGTSEVVLDEPATLWDVTVIEPLGLSVVYSQYLQEGDQVPDHSQDVLFALPLDGGTEPIRIARPVGSFEGGIFGVAWQPDQERFLISMGAEGFEWMSAWSLDGEELPWPANPTPQDGEPGARAWAMTGIPGTNRIAYIESTDPQDAPSYLVIYDTITGTELTRAEVATDAWVSGLHASAEMVAVSRVGLAQIDGQTQYAYRSVIVYDLTSAAVTELDVTGTASVTGP